MRLKPRIPCRLDPVAVPNVRDIQVDTFKLRVLFPYFQPASGCGVLVWFHGGGWIRGDLNDEMDMLTRVCRGEDGAFVFGP
jgi:acetyl esterase/lipase